LEESEGNSDEADEEGELDEKEIDLEDNKQLEALIADGDFGDILKNIKIKKIKNNKESFDNKKEENNSENNQEEEDMDENENDQDSEGKESDESEDESGSEKKQKKKKNDKKVDKLLKFKALGKKRNSDWIIEKEKRKDFFNKL